MFCVMSAVSRPWSWSVTKAWWPAFGVAARMAGQASTFCRQYSTRPASLDRNSWKSTVRFRAQTPFGPAKVGDARLRRDARPGEADDPRRGGDQLACRPSFRVQVAQVCVPGKLKGCVAATTRPAPRVPSRRRCRDTAGWRTDEARCRSSRRGDLLLESRCRRRGPRAARCGPRCSSRRSPRRTPARRRGRRGARPAAGRRALAAGSSSSCRTSVSSVSSPTARSRSVIAALQPWLPAKRVRNLSNRRVGRGVQNRSGAGAAGAWSAPGTAS